MLAFRRIGEAENVRGETRFIFDIMHERRAAAYLRQRPDVAANDRTPAGLRLCHRPAETFEARRIKQRGRAVVERFEQFIIRIMHLKHAIGNVQVSA